jgi:DNA-binding transcriptional regulator YdaS (Cro superfamily)
MTLADYIKGLDIGAREELAASSGTSYLHLRNVAFSGKSCGPQLAVGIEQATTRAVRRWDLRPDDWHRIWPELIGAEGAPAVPVPEEVRDAA